MKEEESATLQFGEQMFIDLTIEDDDYVEGEEELLIRLQSESEEDESSSMEATTEDESLVSNEDHNGINHHPDLLMNSG